jgi:3-oxoacyl-[acyl-carrier protein] reductase
MRAWCLFPSFDRYLPCRYLPFWGGSRKAAEIAPAVPAAEDIVKEAKMGQLTGKVAIVTGASRGIGAAAALALGKAGVTVVLAARDGRMAGDVAQSVAAAGGTAIARSIDVSDYSSVAALVAETHGLYGRLDILVNNAGVIEPIASVADSDPAVWARNIEINLTGAYNPIRAVLPGMIAVGGGTIVNVSSGAAIRPLEGWSAYCAGKAGLAMLTRSVILENPANGIRVFGFQPGTTDTDMQVLIRASGINQVSQIPRENLTPVAHPAAAIVYLCTSAADDLNGQEFSLRDDAFRARLNLGAAA